MSQTFMNHVNVPVIVTETLRRFHFDQIPPQVAIWHQLHDNHHLHKQYNIYCSDRIRITHPSCTHRFSESDNSKKRDDAGMRELSHDGSLLEERDSAVFLGSRLEHLDGHISLTTGTHPHSLVHCSKLACSKMFLCSGINMFMAQVCTQYIQCHV